MDDPIPADAPATAPARTRPKRKWTAKDGLTRRIRRNNTLVDQAQAMALLKPEERKCKAVKRNGEPCKSFAIRGGTVCVYHGGASPQVKKAAQKRLLAMVEPSIIRLEALVHQDLHLPTSLAAVRTVLERAGDEAIGPMKKMVEAQDIRPVINIAIKVGGIGKPEVMVGMLPPPKADIEEDIEGEIVGDDDEDE